MSMPSSKRKKAGTPPSSSKYAGEYRDNAAPFTPQAIKYLDGSMESKGGCDAVPRTHSGRDETGTGKCDNA
jgi:hypothetical protein